MSPPHHPVQESRDKLFYQKIVRVRVDLIEYTPCLRRSKAALSVEVYVPCDCKRAAARLLRLPHRVPEQGCPVSPALEARRDAQRPERHHRKASFAVKPDFRAHEHHVPHKNAVLLHDDVELRHEVAPRAEPAQNKMLVVARPVQVPERISHKALDRPVVRRGLVPEGVFFMSILSSIFLNLAIMITHAGQSLNPRNYSEKRTGKTRRAKKRRPAKSIALSAMFPILVLSFLLQDDPIDRLLAQKESP